MDSEIITNFELPKKVDTKIKVIGVGGGGGNAVNHMYRTGIKDVAFILCNTDAQALSKSPITTKVQLGASLTEGRGAGNRPETGREAALENINEVREAIGENTQMVFITAGMGGGTGTGAAPVIAEECRKLNVLTVGIVTIPFRTEGPKRINQAVEGIKLIEQHVDSLLVINNEKIRDIYGDLSISNAFSKADDVLSIAAKGIAEIISKHLRINVDFEDVNTVMQQSGVAIMGSARATGDNRAKQAIEEALKSPLLNNNDIRGAKNVLLKMTHGKTELTMNELDEIVYFIQEKAGHDADVIWGAGEDEDLEDGAISVTIIATGFSTSSIPEVLAAEKKKKTYFDLGNKKKQTIVDESKSKHVKKEAQDYSDRIEVGDAFVNKKSEAGYSEYDSLYQSSMANRQQIVDNQVEAPKISFDADFSNCEDSYLDEIESVPAYRRKKVSFIRDNQPQGKKVSKHSIKSDENGGISMIEPNSYLHDNVD